MTGEMRSLLWQTIGFLQGISGEIPRADDYATRLTEQMTEHDLNTLYCDSLTSGTVTLKAAPTTYTDECEACEVKL